MKKTNAFIASVKINNWIYYSALDINGLFKYNIITKEQIFLGTFKEKEFMFLHSRAILLKNEIIFVPGINAINLAIYNIKNNTIDYIEIHKENTKLWKYMSCHIVNGNLWLLPSFCDEILIIDIEKREVIDKFKMKDGLGCINSTMIQDIIYCCPWDDGNILFIDTKNRLIDSIKLNLKSRNYIRIYSIGNELILIPKNMNEKIVVYDVLKKEIYYKNLIEYAEGEISTAIILKNHLIIVVAGKTNVLLRINLKTNQLMEKINIDNDANRYVYENIYNSSEAVIKNGSEENSKTIIVTNEETRLLDMKNTIDELKVYIEYVIKRP